MSATKVIVDVDANLFRAAAVCQSKGDVRYYINGVYVTRHPSGGALLVATDGHRMLVAHDTAGKASASKIVRLNVDGLRACAPKKDQKARRLIVDAAGIGCIDGGWSSGVSCFVDGTYPDWRKVIPRQKWINAPSSFNGSYLGDFGKIGAMLYDGSGGTAIRVFTGEDDHSPALIQFPYFNEAFGILMPMRADASPGLPVWMKPVMEPKKKPATRTAKKQKTAAGRKR